MEGSVWWDLVRMELKSLLCEATFDAVKLLQSDEGFPASAQREKPAVFEPPDPATSCSEHKSECIYTVHCECKLGYIILTVCVCNFTHL